MEITPFASLRLSEPAQFLKTIKETGRADGWVLEQRELRWFARLLPIVSLQPWDTHYRFSLKTLQSKKVCFSPDRSLPSPAPWFAAKTRPPWGAE